MSDSPASGSPLPGGRFLRSSAALCLWPFRGVQRRRCLPVSVGKRAVSPLRWCRMSTPGLAPFVGLSCRGHPHSWGAFLRMGETRPSRAPLLPTQPRPLSGPKGVAPRTPALRRCQDSLCSGCLGDGGSRGARGVSQRWGGVWRTEAGRWALATGEDIAGRADTGRAMPGGPPPVPWGSLGI